MKTVYRRQVYMGVVGDMKNLEQHYAGMAEKGWMIDKIGLFAHRYRAVEPCKKRFFVDLLPQITAFDYPENEEAQEYRRICEESGWTFIAANKQFHVFCADGENPAPIPIHTDHALHAKIYLRACRKYELPWFLYILFMFWFFSPLGKGAELFLSNMSLFHTIGYFLLLPGYVWLFGFVISWYIRTKKAAKDGRPMPRVSRRWAKLRGKVVGTGIIALLACMVTGVVLEISGGMPPAVGLAAVLPLSACGVGFGIRRQIDTKRRTRAANIGLAVVALIVMEIVLLGGTFWVFTSMPLTQSSDSLDSRPALFVSDAGVAAPPTWTDIRVSGTPAVPTDYEYWESNGEGAVRTQVYRSVSRILTRWLYDHFAEEFAREFQDRLSRAPEGAAVLTPDEAAFWGAEGGMMFDYANSNAVELLLWNGKTILRLSAEGARMDRTAVSQAVQNLWPE